MKLTESKKDRGYGVNIHFKFLCCRYLSSCRAVIFRRSSLFSTPGGLHFILVNGCLAGKQLRYFVVYRCLISEQMHYFILIVFLTDRINISPQKIFFRHSALLGVV